MSDLHIYQGRVAELRSLIGAELRLGDAIDNLIAFTASHLPDRESIHQIIQLVSYERLEVVFNYVGSDSGAEQSAFDLFYWRCIRAKTARGLGDLSAMAWVAMASETNLFKLASKLEPPKTCRQP